MASFLKFMQNSVLFAINKTHILQKTLSSPTPAIANYSKTSKIYSNLGIPQPPKRPVSAYFRFFKEAIASNQVPGRLVSEKAKETAKQWKSLDAAQKQRYFQAFETDRAAYVKQLEIYKRGLSDNQLEAVKNERKRLTFQSVVQADRKQRKRQLIELGKPKRPSPAYLLFIAEPNNKGLSVVEAASKWSNISASDKEKYVKKARELLNKYNQDMEKWEKEMIAKGNEHLIRKRKTKPSGKSKKDGNKSKKE